MEQEILTPKRSEILARLSAAWKEVSDEFNLPHNFTGEAHPDVFHALQEIEGAMRWQYVKTEDSSTMTLLHVLYGCSGAMERTLWPEDAARIDQAIKEALEAANKPGAKTYTLDEVRERMETRLHNKPAL
jgi:hypothetical protein